MNGSEFQGISAAMISIAESTGCCLTYLLTPFKHYNEETISGVLDGIVTPEDEDSETSPSEDTKI